MKYKPEFKAIQTRYDGHHFRSRLEARWAVFFNALDIEYHYEPEGYSLEGTPYLPDFYLPEQDCFIEIKGIEPTYEEKRKARLLASHTLKPVYIFSGPVGINKHGNGAVGFEPPFFYTADIKGYGNEQKINKPDYLLHAFSKLQRAGLDIAYDEEANDLFIVTDRDVIWPEKDFTWDNIYQHFTDKFQDGLTGIELLKQHQDEICALMRPSPDGATGTFFMPTDEADDLFWCVCTACQKFNIAHGGYVYLLPCKCFESGNIYSGTTKDLLKLTRAYEKARSARFEFESANFGLEFAGE